jgi:hypothetical protein
MDKEHMSKFEQIKQMERDIIRTIIEDAFESGCSIVIDNGEDKSERFTMNLLHNTKAECVDEVMNEINQTDEEYLIFYYGGSKIGWVQLVYGNTGFDVVCDHTQSTEMERLLSRAMALAYKFAEEFYK